MLLRRPHALRKARPFPLPQRLQYQLNQRTRRCWWRRMKRKAHSMSVTKHFTLVKHIQKVQGSKSPDDSTVEWWELRDASGNPAYRQQYTVAFQNGALQETDDVGARELKTKFGHGILIEGGFLPAAPNSGW